MNNRVYPDGAVSLSTIASNLNIDRKYVDKFLQDSGYIKDIRTPTEYGLSHGISMFKDWGEKWPIYSREIQNFVANNLEYMKKAYKYAFQKGGFVREGPVMFGTKCVGKHTISFSKPHPFGENGKLYFVTICEDATTNNCATKTLRFVSDKNNCIPLFDKEEDIVFYLNNFEDNSIIFAKRPLEEDKIQGVLNKYNDERVFAKSLKKENEQLKKTIEQQGKEIAELYKQIRELEDKLNDYEEAQPTCPFMK